MTLKTCKECGKEISSSVAKCPNCGKDQRNWFMRHKVLTVILVLIVIGIIGGAGGSDNKDTEQSTNSESQAVESGSNAPQETVYKVGDAIKTDKFDITVNLVNERETIGESFFVEEPSEGGVYIAVEWKYKNITDKPINTFSFPRIRLVDANGTTYDSDLGASASYATETKTDSKILSDLNPGISVTDAEVFEISKEQFSKEGWYLEIDADKTLKVAIK